MRPGRYLGVGAPVAVLLALTACGGAGGGEAAAPPDSPSNSEAGKGFLDPANFGASIDNPYLPLKPGTRLHYAAKTAEGRETVEVTVTGQTKNVLGVDTVVVHDVARLDGEVIEDTYDWYAQDREGNVWYFGEATQELEDGKVVSTEGSWEAGVDGAEPGIVMKADPQVGDAYRQEFYRGHAEDQAQVLRLGGQADVPYGSFDRLVVTKDFTPLEPDVLEHKYYARGLGPVLEVAVKGGNERLELIKVTRPG